MTAASCNSVCYQRFFQQVEDANPGESDIWVIADNLSSHDSLATRTWLECPSPTARTSTTPPASPPPSSTNGPNPGSGDGHHQLPGTYAVSSPTAFEKRSTKGITGTG
jgi:hypothetical protein